MTQSDRAIKLQKFLTDKIREHGSLSVGDFMGHVLGHAEYGYYMTRDPIGTLGDFITSPETSQIFGEMIGFWLADMWMQMDKPSKFILLECGPGRGTLMADIMRVTQSISGFADAAQIVLLENSPSLKRIQNKNLGQYDPEWIETLDACTPNVPVLFIANEFFDALPLVQYRFKSDQWFERRVIFEEEQFAWLEQEIDFIPIDDLKLHPPKDGQIFEASDIRNNIMEQLSKILKNNGGAGLVFDYGHVFHAYGDTLQAIKDHRFTDVFEKIGDADLTSHVDFMALKNATINYDCDVLGLCTQGEFLKALGIQVHASRLMQKANARQVEDIQTALHRLTHSDEMGQLFKVMGVGYGTKFKAAGF